MNRGNTQEITNNDKIGTFIAVIGGTTQQKEFSDNYILYPFWDECNNGVYEFNFYPIEIPQLNYPRENCTLLVHNDILFVFYGNGKFNEKIYHAEWARVD